eukprot:CAMPEP_0170552228 /NCGR_PEP_ID=MMETSP0211-20121228/10142_1 /TAXON_ID=311385 /ORGANISM="Pseudokeronopsis sp., Strain OXSARD2" /LENGTH=41 /DNA_ID= /DNA_START= /DNA_END= /DNA_ORIENTATION=
MPVMSGDVMMKEVKRMIETNESNMGRYKDTMFIICTAQSEC